MKGKMIKTIILIIMLATITGCSKNEYQKDESYETDIIGTYEVSAKTDTVNETTYFKQYTLNNDNTYNYESNVFGTDLKSNGIYNIRLNCKSKFQCRSKFYHPLKSADFFNFLEA